MSKAFIDTCNYAECENKDMWKIFRQVFIIWRLYVPTKNLSGW